MKISVVLEALTGTFETDIKRASKEAEKAAKQTQEAWKNVGVVLGAAVSSAVATLTALTGKSIAAADALDEMSQRVGVSAKELSTLNYAAERGALDIGKFEAGMVKLTKAASDTSRGVGSASSAFEALGINVKNADGSLKGSDQLLKEISTQFAGMADGAGKTALAVELFGKAGAQMIPFLNQGAEGIAAVQEEARALGLEIDDATAALAGSFNDALGDLRSLATGLGNDLARELLPSLNELAKNAVEAGKQMRAASGGAEVLANGLKVIIAVAYTVKAAIEVVTTAIAAYIDVVIAGAKVAGSVADALNPASQVMRLFGRETMSVSDAVSGFNNALAGAQNGIEGGIEDAVLGLSDAYSALMAPTAAAGQAITETTGAAEDGAPALNNLADANRAAAEAAKQVARAEKENADVWKQSRKELEAYQREWDRAAEAKRRTAERFAEQERDLRFEIQLLGMATDARQAAIIAMEAENMARDENGNVVREQAERYRELLTTLAREQELRAAAAEFQSIWTNAANGVGDALTTALFEGASSGADAIKDVMQQLARDLVRFWIQQKIVIPLQQQIVGGPGGAGGLQLGSGFMGVAAGGLMGYGATGSVGGALGGAAGSWVGGIGATMAAQAVAAGAIGSTLGAILGSALPVVGTLLGAALGDALGSLFGSDPKPRLRINASGAGIGNIGTRGTTALGSLAFNADDLSDTRGTERQLLQAIQALDQGFVTLVGTFSLGQEQLNALRDAASSWNIDLRNSAITAEAVLGSRFGTLLETFDEHIVSFVGSAGTLEERMGRLTEALFIDAAAATGDLVNDFDMLVGLLNDFGREGEAIDVTYNRLLQSTRLLEEALGMMGQNLDLSREAFVTFAAEIAEAAGGLEQATALWSAYFETFYSEQERAELLVSRASQQAASEFADIGLAIEDFMGSTGLADFRTLFERELPNLTAAQVVEWLQAANALGLLGEASAALAEILARAAAQVAAGYTALANATKPSGPPDLGDFGVGLNPGLPADPGGPIPIDSGTPWWMTPGMPGGPVIVNPGDPTYPGGMGGPGAEIDREIDRRYERELAWLRRLADLQNSLLLDERLTTLTPAQQLAEIERQYQSALTGAMAGDEAAREVFDELARQFADIGRGYFGSSAGYDQLFARILADINTLRSTSPAGIADSTANSALTRATAGVVSGAQGDQIAGLRADFAAAMDQLVTIGERQVQLETRIANATEVTAQNTGTPLFPQRVNG